MSSKWSKGTSGPAGDEVRDLVAHIHQVAPTLSESGGHARPGDNIQSSGYQIPAFPGVARTLLGKENSSHAEDQETYVAHTLMGNGFDASSDGNGRATPVIAVNARQDPITSTGAALPLDTDGGSQAIAFSGRNRGAEPSVGREERPPLAIIEKCGSIDTVKPWNVSKGMAVRRLTPRECERLQGFPDDYTAIAIKDKPASDGSRYKALGNSMAVNCMRWIGERISQVSKIPTK